MFEEVFVGLHLSEFLQTDSGEGVHRENLLEELFEEGILSDGVEALVFGENAHEGSVFLSKMNKNSPLAKRLHRE